MRPSMRDWRLPVLTIVAYVVARLSGGSLPFFLLYVTALLWAGGWLWLLYASRRIDCIIQVERDRVEVGESLKVRIRLENDGLVPLPWVEVDDETPSHLVASDRPTQATSLTPFGTRVLALTLTARRRGHYHVGPVRVRWGDPLGLFQRERTFHSRSVITIFPRVYAIESLPIPLSQPFGPVRTQEKAFEDPSNHAEIRPYVQGDNPRHIHWKTSARMGTLMTRQYELSATTQLMLFLDLHEAVQVDRTGEGGHSTEETAVELAASLAALGLRRKVETGLVCQGQERFAVGPGRGQRTFTEILEVLARAQANGSMPIAQVLEVETEHLANRSTLVVITPDLNTRLAEQLLRLRKNHRVLLMLLNASSFAAAGRDQAPAGPDPQTDSLVGLLTLRHIPVYSVPAGADLRLLAEMRYGTGEGVQRWPASGLPQAIS